MFNEYSSNIIIALITSFMSLITLIISQRQNKTIDKIDERTVFIENERRLRRQLQTKEKEKNAIINEIMMMILDTNVEILIHGDQENVVRKKAESLNERYRKVQEDIDDLTKQYDMVLDMTRQYDQEHKKNETSNKK